MFPFDNMDETANTKQRARIYPNHCVLIALAVLSVLLAGCGTAATRNQVPEQYSETTEIPGIPRARFWGDAAPPWIEDWEKMSEDNARQEFPGVYGQAHNYLAISGGGANGAFGAGLLNGWTDAGTRPEFTLVTGISTGSLIAPFAFLGSKYDKILKEVYTGYSTDDLVKGRPWLSILKSDSIGDTAPLREKIAEYVTAEVIREIAAEHRKGRALYIGTVNLDLSRPVIWDIGIIADSGQPGALDLIRDIILASASIPAVFPPVYIQVEASGKTYDEMHVDGGTATQVFLYPLGVDWKLVLNKLAVPGRPHVYVIRNSKLHPGWEKMEPRLIPVVIRSMESLIRTQGIGDMYRMYLGAKRDNLDYNLAYIPYDFNVKATEVFDPVYMNALYEWGYELARQGYPWSRSPPEYIRSE